MKQMIASIMALFILLYIVLNVLPFLVLEGVLLPPWLDTPAAEQITRQYLTAISRSDPVAAKQECKGAEPEFVAQDIAMWGGSTIQDLQFSALERTSPSIGPTRILDVRFSYQRPGQTREQGLLRMFWLFRDGTPWPMPSSETCRGSSGFYGP
jgi:hypothetical protein